MSYIALYRKWRPLVFEDVVEQEHVVKTLKHSVNTGRIAHAYLFCGTRGTGKTTMAHILSRAINCLNPHDGDPCNECEVCKGILSGSILDVLEIDAASNNSVDNIREIRDEVIYAPSRARYKVYIIDEVHMLSSGAFNALLKTLEEPPAHVVFILATTEPHKLPATILSRCQRFDFRRISVESIMGRLEDISKANGLTLQKEASRLIARLSDGALRDAISLLDQCISLGGSEISYNDVLSVVGIVNDTFMSEVVGCISSRDVVGILQLVEKLVMNGKDIVHFISDLIFYFRNLLICKVLNKPEDIIEASPDVIGMMKKQSQGLSEDRITYIIKELSGLEPVLKWSSHPRILLEVHLVKLCDDSSNSAESDILTRLARLEERISNSGVALAAQHKGVVTPSPTQAQPNVEKQKKTPSSIKPPPKTSSAEIKTLECWDKVVNDLKNGGRMALYAFLYDTKAVELDDRFVGIVFKSGNSFNKMNVSRAENIEVVKEALSKALGKTVHAKCLDEEDLIQNLPKKRTAGNDELVERAKVIADKLNVPINIIDE
jgi:DNA polymerase-3 subunit gamma/tau